MWKEWSAIIIFAIVFLGGFAYLIHATDEKREQITTGCEAAGGVPIYGDKHRFKVCLNPDAIVAF